MALENSVSIETGATTVVGYVTQFVAAEGDLLIVNGITAIIATAPSTSSLTLAKPWPGPSVVESTNWDIRNDGPHWRSNVTTNKLVTDLLRKIDGGLPLKPDATGTLAKRAEYNSQTEGFLFLQTDVDPFLIYVKTGPNASDWSTGQQLRADPAASTVEAQQAALAAGQSASMANARANAAQTSAGNAAASEGRAHDWAEKPVGQDVAGPGTRSALHHATSAASFFASFRNVYYGPLPANPDTRPDSTPIQEGDTYTRTTAPKGLKVYSAGDWVAAGFDPEVLNAKADRDLANTTGPRGKYTPNLGTADLNSFVENGTALFEAGAANAPDATNLFIVRTEASDASALYVTQFARAYGIDGASDSKLWKREKNGATWTSWYRIRENEAELDARYVVNSAQVLTDCRLNWASTTQIRLDQCSGSGLTIGGAVRTIPTAGVTLSNSGLAATSIYFIYAYWTGSAIALEASATAFTRHTNGLMIKSGDISRTLVGKVFLNSSGQFEDSLTLRGVLSFYNRVSKKYYYSQGTNVSSTTATVMLQMYVFCWNDHSYVTFVTSGFVNSATILSASSQHSYSGNGGPISIAYTQDTSGGARGLTVRSTLPVPADSVVTASIWMLILYGWNNAAGTTTYSVTTTTEVWG